MLVLGMVTDTAGAGPGAVVATGLLATGAAVGEGGGEGGLGGLGGGEGGLGGEGGAGGEGFPVTMIPWVHALVQVCKGRQQPTGLLPPALSGAWS